jgi:putative heme iron utilization protein
MQPLQKSQRQRILKALREAETPFTAHIARRLGVPERDIFRALPVDACTELDPARVRDILRALGGCGRVYLIVKSEAAVLEAETSIALQQEVHGYYNLMGGSAHAHILPGAVGSAFAVHRSPGSQAPMAYSVQFFGTYGGAVLKVYLVHDDSLNGYSENDLAVFAGIRENYRSTDAGEAE